MKEHKTIVFETSGMIGSVAVAAGPRLLEKEYFSGRMQHTSRLLPAIDELVGRQNWRPEDIELIMVSAGPGSFTGIRVAITTAKSLSFALDVPVVAVPSMEALVLNIDHTDKPEEIQHAAVILEAGRGNIFTAVFRRNETKVSDDRPVPGFTVLVEQSIMKPSTLLDIAPRPLHLLGAGLDYHKTELAANGRDLFWLDTSLWQPAVENVFRCGRLRAEAGLYVQADALTPIYLRQPEAVEKWAELHGG